MWFTPSGTKILSVLFLHEGRFLMSKNNTVKLTLDLINPPPLTDEQKARLTALTAMPDEGIDYSDAPYLSDAVWMKAADQFPAPGNKSRCA